MRNVGRSEERHDVTTLEAIRDVELDMFCTAVIGCSATFVKGGRMVTRRGYRSAEEAER